MKVHGEFEAVDVTEEESPFIVSKGTNTFTDDGRQHVCDWLLHDNFSDDLEAPTGNWVGVGGRSISDMRIVPHNIIAPQRTGTSSQVENIPNCLYPNNMTSGNYMRLYPSNNNIGTSGNLDPSYNTDYGTAFFDFSRPVDLQAMMIWGQKTDSWDCKHEFEICTSPNTFAENLVTPNWTRRKIDWFNSDWNCSDQGVTFGQRLLRLAPHDNPNQILGGVKCLRIRCWWNGTWTNVSAVYYGLWFLEANPYPNTPSVIAIGTGETVPARTDAALVSESVRKFVRVHKSAGTYEVRYSARLDKSDGVGPVFKEIGLFANPVKGGPIGLSNGPSVCSRMLTRGLFETPWSKTGSRQVDVNYTLRVTP